MSLELEIFKAAILILICIGGLYLLIQNTKPPTQVEKQQRQRLRFEEAKKTLAETGSVCLTETVDGFGSDYLTFVKLSGLGCLIHYGPWDRISFDNSARTVTLALMHNDLAYIYLKEDVLLKEGL